MKPIRIRMRWDDEEYTMIKPIRIRMRLADEEEIKMKPMSIEMKWADADEKEKKTIRIRLRCADEEEKDIRLMRSMKEGWVRGGRNEDEEMNEKVILSTVWFHCHLHLIIMSKDKPDIGHFLYYPCPGPGHFGTKFWVYIGYSIERAAGLLMVLGGQAISTRWVWLQRQQPGCPLVDQQQLLLHRHQHR